MSKILHELKRRNVLKETIAYLVVAWLILQVFAIILPIWKSPEWVLQVITITLALGLPLWIIFSWNYEFTTSGIKKTKALNSQSKHSKFNRILNLVIMTAIVVAIGLIWIKPNSVSYAVSKDLSIAVLSFENMSLEVENEWFSDGVTEDILANLSKINNLRVISRTSVKQYKDSKKTIAEIANELGVSFILEGSVRRFNNNILITAQLISATEEYLWTNSYEESFDNAFEIQKIIAKKIAEELRLNLNQDDEQKINNLATTNLEAYKLFIKGRELADLRTKENIESSIRLFKQAIQRDKNFADAYGEMAYSYYLLYVWLGVNHNKKKSDSLIDTNISIALEINPKCVRANTVMGTRLMNQGNYEQAQAYFEKALQENPNDAFTYHNYSHYFANKLNPDFKKQLYYLDEAQKLEPFSRPIIGQYMYSLLINEKPEMALEIFETKKYLFSELGQIRILGNIKSVLNRDWKEKITVLEKSLNQKGNPALHEILAWSYWSILNDYEKFLHHARQYYNINKTRGSEVYYEALLYNDKLDEAKMLLEDEQFLSSNTEQDILRFKGKYHYFKKNYVEALSNFEQVNHYSSPFYKALINAKLENINKVYDIMQQNTILKNQKAVIFAVMNEKDSMYYYLNNASYFRRRNVNGYAEFNPYRKESRFLSYLKENYLPFDELED